MKISIRITHPVNPLSKRVFYTSHQPHQSVHSAILWPGHALTKLQSDPMHSVALAAYQLRQNNHLTHKNGATPHPPAGFASYKFFNSDFLQTPRQPAPLLVFFWNS
ncbi:MAG: hypothetical protein QM578_16490 [Pantoea sp.]